jgi:NAD(P)H dehydrogenase (quinone)
MIIVIGATGQLGSAILERLLDRIPADQIGVSVRDPRQAEALTARGVRVRRGDFDDPPALARAFEGAAQVLIVSGPADPAPHRAAIEAATEAGAKHILYTSHMGANPGSLFTATRAHAQTEHDLQAAGVRFTALRNGFYATSAVRFLGPALQTGELILPEDGPVSWTAHADLAEAAAIALTDEGRLDGITPALTGPEALDFAGLAAVAAQLTGRRITRVTISDEEWKDRLVAQGTPEGYADFALEIFTARRRGEFAAVDPTLEQLLGRKPATFRDVLAATLRPM